MLEGSKSPGKMRLAETGEELAMAKRSHGIEISGLIIAGTPRICLFIEVGLQASFQSDLDLRPQPFSYRSGIVYRDFILDQYT